MTGPGSRRRPAFDPRAGLSVSQIDFHKPRLPLGGLNRQDCPYPGLYNLLEDGSGFFFSWVFRLFIMAAGLWCRFHKIMEITPWHPIVKAPQSGSRRGRFGLGQILMFVQSGSLQTNFIGGAGRRIIHKRGSGSVFHTTVSFISSYTP